MPSKLLCHSCQKTIRINTEPKICNHCHLFYHKKCAKNVIFKAMCATLNPLFTWIDCSSYFSFSDLTDEELRCEMSSPCNDFSNVDMSANQLNLLFANGVNSNEDERDKSDLSYLYNVTEQYVEINSTDKN